MRLLFASLLLLTSCGDGTFQPPAGHALVVVTNTAGTPIPNASTWWLPAGAMANRWWVSGADTFGRDNTFEVLRRHGNARTSDANGLVAAPPGAWVAALSGELAGVTRVPDPLPATATAVRLAIDDWHWVVRTVDDKGAPLADVAIGASPSLGIDTMEPFHVVLGQTDATGRLVVRAPGSIDLEAETRLSARQKGEQHVESPSAILIAEGLGYGDKQSIRLTSRRSEEVTLRLSFVQRIEFTTPEDLWPRGLDAWTRHWGIGSTTEVAGKSVLYSPPGIGMSLMGTPWTWQQPALGVPGPPVGDGLFQVTLPMPPEVAVVRARLLAHDGAPAERCQFLLARGSEQLQSRAWSQPDGTIVLWLNTEEPIPNAMRVEVAASVAPERIGQHTTLVLSELTAGQRVDLGTLTLSKP